MIDAFARVESHPHVYILFYVLRRFQGEGVPSLNTFSLVNSKKNELYIKFYNFFFILCYNHFYIALLLFFYYYYYYYFNQIVLFFSSLILFKTKHEHITWPPKILELTAPLKAQLQAPETSQIFQANEPYITEK